MKVTVFGATGLLGQALLREWRDDQVTGLGSKDADVRSEAQIREVMKRSQPEWVILAAAYTDVDGCETNRDLAFAVNNEGAVSVARVAKEFGPKVIFISTDYVFDGQKKDCLRNRRSACAAKCVRGFEGRSGKANSSDSSGRLHRADFLGVWHRRQMFSGHDFKVGREPRCDRRGG